jgi:uncharacterized protein (DUF885 family)
MAPETSTTLGLDTGARAALRSRLADRGHAGVDAMAALLRDDLAKAEAIDTRGLRHASSRTSAPTSTSRASSTPSIR